MSTRNWFEVTSIAPGVTMIAEPLHAENVKSYLVEGERDVAVIDTGLGVGDFAAVVRRLSSRDPLVLLTHAHWDHIGDACKFPRILVHPAEAYAVRRGFPNAMMRMMFGPDAARPPTLPPDFDIDSAEIPGCEPSGEFNEGDCIDLGGRTLEVFHTPGHSQGGVSLLDRTSGILFSGDAINYGDMWLYLPRSDAATFRETLRKLVRIVDDEDVRQIYPSHFTVPMDPAHVREAREAYEDIWAGRVEPTRHARFDIGFPEKVPSDIFECGRFTFLMGTGRYGEHVAADAKGANNGSR